LSAVEASTMVGLRTRRVGSRRGAIRTTAGAGLCLSSGSEGEDRGIVATSSVDSQFSDSASSVLGGGIGAAELIADRRTTARSLEALSLCAVEAKTTGRLCRIDARLRVSRTRPGALTLAFFLWDERTG
jgi:hypothetical protein